MRRHPGNEQVTPPPDQPPRRLRPFAPYLPSLTRSLGLLAGAFTAAALAQEDLRSAAAAIDWVPLEQLTPEQRALVPDACCGLYVPPLLPPLDGDPREGLLNA